MSSNTGSVQLGGTASNIPIYRIGLGLMFLTMTPQPVPDEVAFEAIKTAFGCVPEGQKLLLNSAEFYGRPPKMTGNLELLARFFTKYPELADRAILAVKGAINPALWKPDNSPAGLRRSVEICLEALDGKKKIDIFQPGRVGRVDPDYPIEDTIKELKALVDEGKFDHIGLSETKAETVRRAHAVHPIAVVEVEVSPWAYEQRTKDVIETTRELRIPILAYSPLGMGFLTGKIKREELPVGDPRTHFPKWDAENASRNQGIVDILSAAAKTRNMSTAQYCLAWVASLGPHVVPIPGSGKVERVKENFGAGEVYLSAEEIEAVQKSVQEHGVHGGKPISLTGRDYSWG
ncbi:hypothetical protein FRB99_001248 [Tulasnella sp. 403]|nr:hypothetical protein FRB99_001248 [Tulasnella sp. 403]